MFLRFLQPVSSPKVSLPPELNVALRSKPEISQYWADLTYALLTLITAIPKVGLLHGHQYDMLTRGETVIKGE